MKRHFLCGFAACAAFAALPFAVVADTDAYGNEIWYESDGTTVKYQFWYSEQKAEDTTKSNTSTCSCTNAEAFESRSRTWLSAIGRICSTPWVGFFLIVR
jgi:hypothetical protein